MHTIRYYPYEAGRTLYPIDFMLGILSRSHVYVYTGEDHLEQVSYTWVNDGQISLNTPLTVGQELKIQRKLPTSLFNDFENGARLSAKNLDNAFLQALMLHEEVLDGFLGNEFRLQSANFIVKNLEVLQSITVPEPSGNNSATSKNYVDTEITNLKNFTINADKVLKQYFINLFGSTVSAASSANNALQYSLQALQYRNEAATSASISYQHSVAARDSAMVLKEVLNDAVASGMSFPLDLGFIYEAPVNNSFDLGGL